MTGGQLERGRHPRRARPVPRRSVVGIFAVVLQMQAHAGGRELQAEMLENPFNDRWRLDAGDDPQAAAALPAGFIGHIPVPEGFAATFGRANRQACRFVNVDSEHALEALRSSLIARCRSVAAASPRSLAGAAQDLGTIRARSGLAGANTPWYLVRCAEDARGRARLYSLGTFPRRPDSPCADAHFLGASCQMPNVLTRNTAI